MCDTRFPKHFRELNNVIKYDGKTNSNVQLEDYHLVRKAGGANDDLFIIQFLPIYLADLVRAWPDHLPINMIVVGRITRRSSRATVTSHP
jgi:hypothetical protein